MAGGLGTRVLYVATALPDGDPDLEHRVSLHRERRPDTWGTMDAGDLAPVPGEAERWDAVLLDSLTLWVSERLYGIGEQETLKAFEEFLERAAKLQTPFVLVSDEVGLGIVPESRDVRVFRDVLGSVNQLAAAVAGEVHLCVAGIGLRIK
jgi:adenosylcobinamide kinase / adenosylcobinamide-phosphate guanylyltransferase